MSKNDRFLKACRCQPVDATPIWLMRQAGRYMPEYRKLRDQHGFLEMVKTPELATEITLQPVHAFDVDAAIVFADILTLLEAAGLPLRFADGEGPVIEKPVRQAGDVDGLQPVDAEEDLAFTLRAIELTQQELGGDLPLIGFSGAPFTLASYAIEGGSSKSFETCLAFMRAEPQAWHALMQKLTEAVADYMLAQARAGADALQLFDSWAGILDADAYREFALPYTRQVFNLVRSGTHVPLIHFGTRTGPLLPLIAEARPDVMGIDAETSLRDAADLLGPEMAVQGNLDPTCLLGDGDGMEDGARALLESMKNRPGHIFNLGHGVIKETPVENVRRLVEFVHAQTS